MIKITEEERRKDKRISNFQQKMAEKSVSVPENEECEISA